MNSSIGANKNSVPSTRALQQGQRLSNREAPAEALQLKDGLFERCTDLLRASNILYTAHVSMVTPPGKLSVCPKLLLVVLKTSFIVYQSEEKIVSGGSL